MKVVRVDPLSLDLNLEADDIVERFYGLYGRRPRNVTVRLPRRWNKGFFYDSNKSIVIWADSVTGMKTTLIHELAHFKAGAHHDHDAVFYRTLWEVANALGGDLDDMERIERDYKPRNSKTFTELRAKSGQRPL